MRSARFYPYARTRRFRALAPHPMPRLLLALALALLLILPACAPAPHLNRSAEGARQVQVDSRYLDQLSAKDPAELTAEEIAYLQLVEQRSANQSARTTNVLLSAMLALSVVSVAAIIGAASVDSP